jgi:hypothetical protein
MKTLIVSLVPTLFLVSFAGSQSIYIGTGGGFTYSNMVSNYVFTFEPEAMPWPGKIEEISGERNIGFNFASGMEFQLPSLPIRITGGISYIQLYGKADFVKSSGPPWSNSMYISGELETRNNILTLKSGLLCEILNSQIVPYASLDVLYNIFGETRLSIKNSFGTTEGIVKANTRMGLALGGGVSANLSPLIDTRIGVNYSFNNLITPEKNEEQRNSFNVTATIFCKVL